MVDGQMQRIADAMERIAKSNEEISVRHAVRQAKDMEVNDAILECRRLEAEVLRLRATQAREDIARERNRDERMGRAWGGYDKVASEVADVLDGKEKNTDGNG